MELIKMLGFNLIILGVLAYLIYLGIKSTKNRHKHNH